MTRLQRLRQIGISFDQSKPDCDALALQYKCKEIYRAAFDRVTAKADYVDRLRACYPEGEKPPHELSETFRVKDRELSAAIEAIWLSEAPNMDEFKKVVLNWEEQCIKELDAWQKLYKKPDPKPQSTATQTVDWWA